MEWEEWIDEEFQTPAARLALELAREDQQLLARLIELRKARMSQEKIAEAMGISQATVSAFERLGNDPRLSTLRRYARALGVMVRHHVDPDALDCHDSHYIAHVSERGVTSMPTAAAALRSFSATRPSAVWEPPTTVETARRLTKAAVTP